jgi:hypothetical protein
MKIFNSLFIKILKMHIFFIDHYHREVVVKIYKYKNSIKNKLIAHFFLLLFI